MRIVYLEFPSAATLIFRLWPLAFLPRSLCRACVPGSTLDWGRSLPLGMLLHSKVFSYPFHPCSAGKSRNEDWQKFSLPSFNFSSVFVFFSLLLLFHSGIRPSVVLYIAHRSKIIHFNGVVWCAGVHPQHGGGCDDGNPEVQSDRSRAEWMSFPSLMGKYFQFKFASTLEQSCELLPPPP